MLKLRTQRTAAAGGAVLILRYGITAVLNYGFGVALVWLLPRSQFGVVSVVQNLLALAAAALAGSLPWALARIVARSDGLSDEAGDSAFRAALFGNVGLGAVLATVFMFAQFGSVPIIPDGSLLLSLIVVATVLLLSLNAVLVGALQGYRRFDGLGLMQTIEILGKVATGLALVGMLGLGVTGVAAGFLVGAVIATCCGWWALRDRIPGRGPMAGRSTFADAGAMGIGTTSFYLLVTLDVIMLSMLLGADGAATAVVATYQAAAILSRIPFFLADALSDAVFPLIARGRTKDEQHAWFVAAFRWVPLGVLPLQIVLLVVPDVALRLFFPPEYEDAVDLVRIVTFGTLGLIVVDMLLKALYARGAAAAVARRIPIAVAAELVAILVVVPQFGAAGAAVAFAIGSWVAAVLLGVFYLRQQPFTRLPVEAVARYVTAIAVLLLGLAIADVGPQWLQLPAIAMATGAYAFAALRLRVVRDEDVTRVAAVLHRLLPSKRTSASSPDPSTPARSSRAGAFLRHAPIVVGSLGLAVTTVLWNISRSPDAMYDEIVYTIAAQRVAEGLNLTWTNQPLFVHPPLSFLAQAAWLRVFDLSAAPVADAVVATRWLAGLVTVADLLLLGLLAARLIPAATARRRLMLTLVVVGLACVEPILLRYGRVALIEPFALLGCLITLHTAISLRRRSASLMVLVVGLATGLSLLTKELSIFLLLTPAAFAALGREWRALGRSVGALCVGLGVWLLFPFWAFQLDQVENFLEQKLVLFDRLIGTVQDTGWNRPGQSFITGVIDQTSQYASSYLLLATGALAFVWLLLHQLSEPARWLMAWLLTSYAFGAYCVLLGTLNEHFFVYVLPAALVGSVLVGEALVRRIAEGRWTISALRRQLPAAVSLAIVAAMLGFGLFGWARFYASSNDGVFQATSFLRGTQPSCAAIDQPGDAEKFSYLLPGYPITDYATGAGALSHGVELFLLSEKEAALRNGNATPELTAWVQERGEKLASFVSVSHGEYELYRVAADPYDPLVGVERIENGVFVVTAGSLRCSGFAVVNGSSGEFEDAWNAAGGKAIVGSPVTGSWSVGERAYQVFAGLVLENSEDGTRALSIVPRLATAAPNAYRLAGLPPVDSPSDSSGLTNEQVLARLSDPDLASAYLGAPRDGATTDDVEQARRLLGDPIGPAALMPDGVVRQAFAGAVLERPAASPSVRMARTADTVIAARIVTPPSEALRAAPPPSLPDVRDPTVPEPTDVRPFLKSLAAVLAAFAVVAVFVVRAERRRSRQARGTEGTP